MAEKKLHYPNVYKHRAHRVKYQEAYGAEGMAQGKTDIGEFRAGCLEDTKHGMKQSPKDQTWEKSSKELDARAKGAKTKPDPY